MDPAAWYPDPTGRHESRYWDGAAWTDAVADAGRSATDPPRWPAPVGAAGGGLASAALAYQRGDGRIPWTVVDAAGTVVGWVVPPARVSTAEQTVPLLDGTRTPVATLGHGAFGGDRVVVGDAEVARLRPGDATAVDRVTWSVEVAGTTRLRLDAALATLHADAAAVVDPGGAAVATVSMRWNGDGQVDLLLRRMTTFPATLDAALLLLPVAVALDLDRRAVLRDGPAGSPWWPGL